MAAMQFPESEIIEVPLDSIRLQTKASWVNYPLGVVNEFAKLKAIAGFDLLLDADVPIGSGLSSSAAIEVATAFALDRLWDAELSREEIAHLARGAECDFVGVPCGIMDQAASACCSSGHALRLDCSSTELSCAQISIPPGVAFIVAHSGVRRSLNASSYAQRQRECAEALEAINRETRSAFKFLCRISWNIFENCSEQIGKNNPTMKRARYAIEEQKRVEDFCAALASGDLAAAGRLMSESHFGLRDLYEVSCPELDDLTAKARDCEGVYGSRLTGAGFGGCAVAMADAKSASSVIQRLKETFYRRRGIEPLIFETPAMNGATAGSL